MAKVKHIRRLQEILTVFVRFGFSQLIETSGLAEHFENIKNIIVPKKKIERLRVGQRLAGVFSELGPTFIKFGQFLSTRPDLIPETIAEDLKVLQDLAPPESFDAIKEVLKHELGEKVNRLSELDQKPLASASIAQVHKARLDDKPVAVKIQRPGIAEKIRTDLEVLHIIARPLSNMIKQFRTIETIRLFERDIRKELNFLNEYRNILRFGQFFDEHPHIRVPAVYRRLSTSRVLVMELIDGVKISDLEAIEEMGLNPKEITKRGADLIFRQLFEFGFFHGDPHPGNILVCHDGRITLIDFGIVGYIDEKTRDSLAEILIGYLHQDTKRIVYALEDLGVTEGVIDETGLERDISELIDGIKNLPIEEVVVKEAVDEIIAIIRSYGLKFPPQLFLLGKSLAMIEDVGLRLDPDFDVVNSIKPHVQQFLRRRYRIERLLRRVSVQWTDISSLLKILPSSIRKILSRLAREEYRFTVDLKGTETVSNAIERSLNRLSLSLLSAALVIAGSAFSFKPIIRIILLAVAVLLFGVVILGIIRTRKI